jgi:thiamine-phosphate pyrophosphorylase
LTLSLPTVYPITDTTISGLSHARQVEALAAGGATIVQLRDKTASPRAFYDAVIDALKVAGPLGVKIIVNDRADIAVAAGAAGVHLGQEDLPVEYARKLVGSSRIVGYSTHSIEQAIAADALDIDYIAIGPIFETTSKQNPDPVLGLDAIRRIKPSIHKPLVAIGGMTLERAQLVIEAGADCVALISDLIGAADIAARARLFIEQLR